MENMLGVLFDLFQKLNSPTGEEWAAALERFLRKENPREAVKPSLTPTTYGLEIQSPFEGCILEDDGPGDELLDVSKLELSPILKSGEAYISFKKAVSRSKDWGQRAAEALERAGNAGKISEKVWPVGRYVVCGKTVWRDPDGGLYAWCVSRGGHGFYCYCNWFCVEVDSDGRRLSPRK